MTTSELRRMAAPLLERSLIPPDTIEELKERSRRRPGWQRASWTHRAIVIAVAAAMIVVFFVPLPHVSLFHSLVTPAKVTPTNTAPVTSTKVTPTAVTGADGYLWMLGTYPCSSGTCDAVTRSTDGGVSFVRVGLLPGSVDSLTFANRQDGYAFSTGDKPSVFWTGDGGRTWRRVQIHGALVGLVTAGGYGYVLTCVPASSGCSASPPSSYLAVSPVVEDEWTTMALPKATEGQIVRVSASGSRLWLTVAPAGGGEARLLVSDNRGRTFSLVASKGLGGQSSLAVATSNRVLWGEIFGGGMAALSRSTDGGKTFVLFPEDAAGQSFTMGAEIFPLSNTEEVVVDRIVSGFWRTENGGHSFQRMLSNQGIFAVGFVSATTWIALGGRQPDKATRMWRTTNGGHTWQSVKAPTVPTPLPAVDLSATPAGWVPIDLGDAQISVPSTWWVSYGSTPCGTTPRGLLDVQLPKGPAWCSGTAAPKSIVTLNQEVGTYHLPPAPSLEINGIPLYIISSGTHSSMIQYLAPTLEVVITTIGPGTRGVLDTLSVSPREVVLSQMGHDSLAIPTSWRWHTFAGVRFATPAGWPTQHSSVAVACRSYVALGGRELVRYSATKHVVLPDKPIVELDTDATAYDGTCPPGPYQESAPGDGVQIDVGTPKVPVAWPLPADHRIMLKGVKAYVNALQNFDILSVLVVVPGRAMPLDIWIGLAGNGIVARTVLYSLRAT